MEEIRLASEDILEVLKERCGIWKVDIARTLGLLDLPIDLKNKLLLSKNTPVEVKARFGNEEAQNKILEIFRYSLENTPSYNIMHSLGKKLLYMNTQEGLDLFYQAIQSQKSVIGPYNNKQYSVAYVMINNYGGNVSTSGNMSI